MMSELSENAPATTGSARDRGSRCNTAVLEAQLRDARGWHDLMVLRFLSQPRVFSALPEHLIGVYHSMHAAGPLMEAARARSIALSPECRVAALLVDYWERHLREEAGHDAWLLADLRRLGVDTDAAMQRPPAPEIAELMGTLHFWVLHTHPVAVLAYFYIVERSPPTVTVLDWLVRSAGIPREGLETFYRHAAIDAAHGRELEDLIDELPLSAAHMELLAVCGRTVLLQLARILERNIDPAGAALS